MDHIIQYCLNMLNNINVEQTLQCIVYACVSAGVRVNVCVFSKSQVQDKLQFGVTVLS